MKAKPDAGWGDDYAACAVLRSVNVGTGDLEAAWAEAALQTPNADGALAC